LNVGAKKDRIQHITILERIFLPQRPDNDDFVCKLQNALKLGPKENLEKSMGGVQKIAHELP